MSGEGTDEKCTKCGSMNTEECLTPALAVLEARRCRECHFIYSPPSATKFNRRALGAARELIDALKKLDKPARK